MTLRPSLETATARDDFLSRRVIRLIYLVLAIVGMALLLDVAYDMLRAKPGHYIPQWAQIVAGMVGLGWGTLGLQRGEAREALSDLSANVGKFANAISSLKPFGKRAGDELVTPATVPRPAETMMTRAVSPRTGDAVIITPGTTEPGLSDDESRSHA